MFFNKKIFIFVLVLLLTQETGFCLEENNDKSLDKYTDLLESQYFSQRYEAVINLKNSKNFQKDVVGKLVILFKKEIENKKDFYKLISKSKTIEEIQPYLQ